MPKNRPHSGMDLTTDLANDHSFELAHDADPYVEEVELEQNNADLSAASEPFYELSVGELIGERIRGTSSSPAMTHRLWVEEDFSHKELVPAGVPYLDEECHSDVSEASDHLSDHNLCDVVDAMSHQARMLTRFDFSQGLEAPVALSQAALDFDENARTPPLGLLPNLKEMARAKFTQASMELTLNPDEALTVAKIIPSQKKMNLRRSVRLASLDEEEKTPAPVLAEHTRFFKPVKGREARVIEKHDKPMNRKSSFSENTRYQNQRTKELNASYTVLCSSLVDKGVTELKNVDVGNKGKKSNLVAQIQILTAAVAWLSEELGQKVKAVLGKRAANISDTTRRKVAGLLGQLSQLVGMESFNAGKGSTQLSVLQAAIGKIDEISVIHGKRRRIGCQ